MILLIGGADQGKLAYALKKGLHVTILEPE